MIVTKAASLLSLLPLLCFLTPADAIKGDNNKDLALRGTTANGRALKKGSKKGTRYYADLGEYGRFEMEISGDDSKMSFKTELKNIDSAITSVGYHLHTMWNFDEGVLDAMGDDCGGMSTGGHYDPNYGCGGASAADADVCTAIEEDRGTEYACAGAYDGKAYYDCEVGDLSGKFGSIDVDMDGKAKKSVENDPYPALNVHYEPEKTEVNNGNKFAAVVFHNLDKSGARFLCGKLVVIED